jgi:hypothetical protein
VRAAKRGQQGRRDGRAQIIPHRGPDRHRRVWPRRGCARAARHPPCRSAKQHSPDQGKAGRSAMAIPLQDGSHPAPENAAAPGKEAGPAGAEGRIQSRAPPVAGTARGGTRRVAPWPARHPPVSSGQTARTGRRSVRPKKGRAEARPKSNREVRRHRANRSATFTTADRPMNLSVQYGTCCRCGMAVMTAAHSCCPGRRRATTPWHRAVPPGSARADTAAAYICCRFR